MQYLVFDKMMLRNLLCVLAAGLCIASRPMNDRMDQSQEMEARLKDLEAHVRNLEVSNRQSMERIKQLESSQGQSSLLSKSESSTAPGTDDSEAQDLNEAGPSDSTPGTMSAAIEILQDSAKHLSGTCLGEGGMSQVFGGWFQKGDPQTPPPTPLKRCVACYDAAMQYGEMDLWSKFAQHWSILNGELAASKHAMQSEHRFETQAKQKCLHCVGQNKSWCPMPAEDMADMCQAPELPCETRSGMIVKIVKEEPHCNSLYDKMDASDCPKALSILSGRPTEDDKYKFRFKRHGDAATELAGYTVEAWTIMLQRPPMTKKWDGEQRRHAHAFAECIEGMVEPPDVKGHGMTDDRYINLAGMALKAAANDHTTGHTIEAIQALMKAPPSKRGKLSSGIDGIFTHSYAQLLLDSAWMFSISKKDTMDFLGLDWDVEARALIRARAGEGLAKLREFAGTYLGKWKGGLKKQGFLFMFDWSLTFQERYRSRYYWYFKTTDLAKLTKALEIKGGKELSKAFTTFREELHKGIVQVMNRMSDLYCFMVNRPEYNFCRLQRTTAQEADDFKANAHCACDPCDFTVDGTSELVNTLTDGSHLVNLFKCDSCEKDEAEIIPMLGSDLGEVRKAQKNWTLTFGSQDTFIIAESKTGNAIYLITPDFKASLPGFVSTAKAISDDLATYSGLDVDPRSLAWKQRVQNLRPPNDKLSGTYITSQAAQAMEELVTMHLHVTHLEFVDMELDTMDTDAASGDVVNIFGNKLMGYPAVVLDHALPKFVTIKNLIPWWTHNAPYFLHIVQTQLGSIKVGGVSLGDALFEKYKNKELQDLLTFSAEDLTSDLVGKTASSAVSSHAGAALDFLDGIVG